MKNDAALRNSLAGYFDSARSINAEYTNLINDYNQLGAAKPKPFDQTKLDAIEALLGTHVNNFETVYNALHSAAVRYRKQATILSGILISVTWLLGLFVTWALIQTVYTILLARNAKRKLCSRQGLKPILPNRDVLSVPIRHKIEPAATDYIPGYMLRKRKRA